MLDCRLGILDVTLAIYDDSQLNNDCDEDGVEVVVPGIVSYASVELPEVVVPGMVPYALFGLPEFVAPNAVSYASVELPEAVVPVFP
jgi:hypothetical protein